MDSIPEWASFTGSGGQGWIFLVPGPGMVSFTNSYFGGIIGFFFFFVLLVISLCMHVWRSKDKLRCGSLASTLFEMWPLSCVPFLLIPNILADELPGSSYVHFLTPWTDRNWGYRHETYSQDL